MRRPRNIDEAQTAARRAGDLRNRVEGRDIDLNGHRVTGAAPSRHQNDYVTRQELGVEKLDKDEQIKKLWATVHDLIERVYILENP